MASPPYRLAGLLPRLGFDRPKFHYGLQIATAAFVALLIAWGLQLEHPQWAAITLFVTSQPTRGQFIEKGFYRVLGTLTGCAFGAALAWASGGNLLIELVALTLWSGLMVFAGSLQRAYRTYGTVLAGYSAIIVTAFAPFNPDVVQDVALDRIASVLIGVIVGIAWAWGSRMANADREVWMKARRLTADILACAAAGQEPGRSDGIEAMGRMNAAAGLLMDELHMLSSTGRAARAGQVEHLLAALVNLMFAAHQHAPQPGLAEGLRALSQKLHAQNDFAGASAAVRRLGAGVDHVIIDEALSSVMLALRALEDERPEVVPSKRVRRRYTLDWAGATQGAIRIMVVLALSSVLWLVMGEQVYHYPLISAAICISLATTGATPSRKMVDVIKGQTAAMLVSTAIASLLWPLFPSPAGQLLSMLPAFIIYALIRSHRRMSLSAADYSITCFLLLTPVYLDWTPDVAPWWKGVLAASGGCLGYLAFFLIFPTDERARRKALWLMVKRDLQQVAVSSRLGISAEDWRLSFCQRFLRIAHWAAQEGGRYEPMSVTTRKAAVTLRLSELVFMLRRMERQADVSPDLRRATRAGLARLSGTDRESPRLIRAFTLLQGRLARAGREDEARLAGLLVDDLTALGQARLRHP